jgi:ABC-2 type transport system ATP-binding protein
MAEMYGIRSKPARERGVQLLEALGLGDRAHRRAATLSGGMKRRLNLLLALAHDPSVVLLDEPEAGLDPQSRVLVRDFVLGLAHRKTVILTSHNMDEVDRSLIEWDLNEGRLLVVRLRTPAQHRGPRRAAHRDRARGRGGARERARSASRRSRRTARQPRRARVAYSLVRCSTWWTWWPTSSMRSGRWLHSIAEHPRTR